MRPVLQSSWTRQWMWSWPLQPSSGKRVGNYSWYSFAHSSILQVKILRSRTYCSRSQSNYQQASDLLMVKARGPGKAANDVCVVPIW